MKPLALIIFGSVGTKVGRIKNSQKATLRLAEIINPSLIDSRFLNGAPFDLINGIVRWGDKYSDTVEVGNVDRRHKELPVAFEVPLDELRLTSVDELFQIYLKYTLEILDAVAEKFDLDREVVKEFRVTLQTDPTQPEPPKA